MHDAHAYKPLGRTSDDNSSSPDCFHESLERRACCYGWNRYLVVFLFLVTATAGFLAGFFAAHGRALCGDIDRDTITMASIISLVPVPRQFRYDSMFSEEPPHGPDSGNVSEPIWDTLIPSQYNKP